MSDSSSIGLVASVLDVSGCSTFLLLCPACLRNGLHVYGGLVVSILPSIASQPATSVQHNFPATS